MNWALILYLSTVSEKLNQVTFFFFAMSVIACIVGLGAFAAGKSDDMKSFVIFGKKALKLFVPIAVLTLLATTLLPDQKTILAMVAANGIQELAESEDVTRVAGKSLTLLEQYIDERTKVPE